MEHQMLLEAYLKRLKLPAMLAHYQEMARQAEQGNQTFEGYLLALSELETQQRDENAYKRRVSQARFPLLKTLDRFHFSAIPTLNKATVLHLAQGEYIGKRENLLHFFYKVLLELVAKPHRHFLNVIMIQANWKKATNIPI
jgi:DNA replication protein DnaC